MAEENRTQKLYRLAPYRFLWCYKPHPNAKGNTWMHETTLLAIDLENARTKLKERIRRVNYRNHEYMILDIQNGEPGQYWCKVMKRWTSEKLCEYYWCCGR